MSNSDVFKPASSTKKAVAPSSSVKEKIADAGAEMKQRAGEALQSSADTARDTLGEASDAAREVANDAMDQFHDKARGQQQSGADFVERLAGNFREAAGAFEKDVPFAARGIQSAADYVQDAASKIRRQPPRPRGRSNRFCQAAARGLSGHIGSGRLRSSTLSEGVGRHLIVVTSEERGSGLEVQRIR